MKKIFGLMLLCATMVGFSSCEKDDVGDDSYPSIVGTWHQVVGNSSGEYVSMSTEIYWIFREDNTATEQLVVRMDGTIINTQNLRFNYSYSGKYVDLKNDKTSIRYNVSISGNKMHLGNDESGYFDLTKID